MALEWAEYIAVVLSLFFSIVISVISSRKDSKLGNNENKREPKLALLPVIASLIASYTSGVSLLGKPAESYQFGIGFQIFYSIIIIVNFSLLHLFFLPVLMKMRSSSIYEYFRLRFDSRIERLALVIFITTKVFQSALTSLPAAYIVYHFSGLSLNSTILLLIPLTTFYTMIGGLKGVVWTDTLQAMIILIAMVALLVVSVLKVGGIGVVFQLAYDTGRLAMPIPSFDVTDRLSLWAFLVAFNICLSMNQSWYQRIRGLSSHKKVKMSILSQASGMLIFGFGSCFMGLTIHAHYYGCDPKEAQLIDSYSNIVVYWLDDVGRRFPGLRGLYIAGITCASISTMSTYTNTVGTMIVDDLLRYKSNRIKWIRIWTTIVGVVVVFATLLIKNSSSLVELTYVFISLEGTISGLFILGMFLVPANAKGALAGSVSSFLFNLLLIVGSSLFGSKGSGKRYASKSMSTELCNFNVTTKPLSLVQHSAEPNVFFLFKISPFSYGFIAVITTIIVGIVVSWLLPDIAKDNRNNTTGASELSKRDPNLYSPWVQRFLPEITPISPRCMVEVSWEEVYQLVSQQKL